MYRIPSQMCVPRASVNADADVNVAGEPSNDDLDNDKSAELLDQRYSKQRTYC